MTIEFIASHGLIDDFDTMNNCCGSIFGLEGDNPGIRIVPSSCGTPQSDSYDELEEIVKLDEDNFIHYLHTVVCPPMEYDDDNYDC